MQFLQIIMLASLVMFASAQCTGTRMAGSYMLSWEVSDDGLSVEFNVSVTTAADTWVATGFSATLNMLNSDIAIAADDGTGNNSFVEDRYVGNIRTIPTYDRIQSFTNTMTERTGGVLFFTFTRRIVSTDTSGQDINLNVCRFIIWAWRGTVSDFESPAMFGRHTQQGGFSDQMCLQQCDRVSSGVGIAVSIVVLAFAALISLVTIF